ncbi:MAG: hypothetical protein AAF664_02590 [Planctomycetota bacterium]
MSLLKHLKQRWSEWTGDKEMELAIRRALLSCGYFGNTAKIRGLRLVAVQRPGWLQVMRFDATARIKPESNDDDQPDPDAEYMELYGLVREDVRKNDTTIRIFEAQSDRVELFNRWSEGLIVTRGAGGLTD